MKRTLLKTALQKAHNTSISKQFGGAYEHNGIRIIKTVLKDKYDKHVIKEYFSVIFKSKCKVRRLRKLSETDIFEALQDKRQINNNYVSDKKPLKRKQKRYKRVAEYKEKCKAQKEFKALVENAEIHVKYV